MNGHNQMDRINARFKRSRSVRTCFRLTCDEGRVAWPDLHGMPLALLLVAKQLSLKEMNDPSYCMVRDPGVMVQKVRIGTETLAFCPADA